MIISLGSNKIERLRFIAKRGKQKKVEDPDGVMDFCIRNGYVLVDAQPVHKILLEHTRSGNIGKKKLPPVKDPFKIIKELVLFTAERPLK
jgi:hypothetical protein